MLDSIREDATKRSSNSGGCDEDTNSLRLHLARVPQRKVVRQSRKESSFSQPKEETSAAQNERNAKRVTWIAYMTSPW